MATKAEKAPAATSDAKEPLFLYDANSPQIIPLTITKNGKSFRVEHSFRPLTNERYFEFQERIDEVSAKTTKLSTAIFEPKESLWSELIEGVTGYKPRDDFKAGVPMAHRTEAVNALITILTEIKFRAIQAGVLLPEMSHSFRAETKAEMDEYLAIQSDQPNPNALASAQKLSKAERLYRLGKKILKDTAGYAADAEIPAWHLAATTESFFTR
jgi:hypothetical protein